MELKHFIEFCCCCCLPTPLTLVCRGSPIIPILVHQPAYPSSGQQLYHSSGVCPQIYGSQCGAHVGAVEDGVCVAEGHSGDGYDLASTLNKYDLRKGNLIVLSWARVRRVRRSSISSELLMCGRGERSILLLLLVARCIDASRH